MSKRALRWAALAAGIYGGWRVVGARRALRLQGAVVAITGGSRGLGYLLARELAGARCRLAICARDGEELARAQRSLQAMGAEVFAVTCDVGQRAQVEHFIAEVERRFGRIDVLVNNASVIQVGPLESMSVEDFESGMAINFWGTLYATMAALPGMRARGGGRIVNITSIGGKIAVPHLLPYECAKFAAVGLSEGLRAELAQDGILVTTVIPGFMRTGSQVHALFKGAPGVRLVQAGRPAARVHRRQAGGGDDRRRPEAWSR